MHSQAPDQRSSILPVQGGEDVWTTDVLNLGIRPDKLIETVRRRFEAAGGSVIDERAAQGAVVHLDGVALPMPDARPDERSQVTCRLLLDCMGHASPIVRQVRCVRHLPAQPAVRTRHHTSPTLSHRSPHGRARDPSPHRRGTGATPQTDVQC